MRAGLGKIDHPGGSRKRMLIFDVEIGLGY
jgi:hypothetical protein